MGGSMSKVSGGPPGGGRVALAVEGLRARRAVLEDELLARVHAISDSTQVSEQEYVIRLGTAVKVGVDYAFDAMRACDVGGRLPPVPTQLLVQAHLAARNEVSLDTVLRRYCSGNSIVVDALLDEAERAGLSQGELKPLLGGLAAGLDSVLECISDEYAREVRSRPRGGGQRQVELVKGLLAGERAAAPELKYGFDGWHVGFVCAAPEPSAIARELVSEVDRALLVVSPAPEVCWAWMGGRRDFADAELGALLATACATKDATYVAFGEPAKGTAGWRLTHRQAASALPLARRSPRRVSRYSEVSLITSAIKDELLARSLRQLFLEPLEEDRDRGRIAKQTLRAYFETSRNVSSTAAALGVSRRTVAKRLAAIEQRIGRPLDKFAAEIQTAIRLEEFEGSERAQ
jgi:PucR C-terminal helix-turn-helix domain